MKQKILSLFVFYCLLNVTAVAQFYHSFENSSFLQQATAAIELNDGFVFGFTESNSQQNFHENILLIKTNASGNIIWSKRYDAGTGISVRLSEMMRTFDNEILISGSTGLDNNFNSSRCLLKINSKGKILWLKKYNSGNPYNFKGLVQLKDSSFVFSNTIQQLNPGLIQVNKNGDVIGAAQITNRMFESIESITAIGNTADIVVASSNVVNINFKTRSIVWQRQYNTSNQFTAFLSTRCRNGDIVYLAGRTSGGVLNGTSRIFRTTANGNLLWAKNIQINYDNKGQITSIFDIVNQVYVHEDINGNIVAFVQDESTRNVMLVFNAAGNYLYHRFFNSSENFIAEISNGSYLHTCAFSNTPTDPLISNRFLSALSNCDSAIFVNITNGTDSAANLNALNFATVKINATVVPVAASNAIIQQHVYCNPTAKNNAGKKDAIAVTIIPNPALDKILVKTAVDFPFCIYNSNGDLLLKAMTNQSTGISKLTPGIYMIEIQTQDGTIRKRLVKQ
jgi:hypothetical protein